MPLVILSFFAGVLTIAAPCILPLLPVVIGGSLTEDKPSKLRPIVIALSLAISVIVFSLLLKATTSLLSIPQEFWQWFSATILILLGVSYLKPSLWEKVSLKLSLNAKSNKKLSESFQKKGLGGAALTGAALGPVFNSCSPTYALIVAVIIPASFFTGLSYLIAYALGLSLSLLALAFLGQGFRSKFRKLANPTSKLKKAIGIIFILVGLFIGFGLDKELQAYILEKGWYAPISDLEVKLKN
jgi:cytochrome c-type biogenesis protein